LTQNRPPSLSLAPHSQSVPHIVGQVAAVIGIFFVFLLSIEIMVGTLRLFSHQAAQEVFALTNNPFVSIFIGLLVTSIVQSSSTTTSLTVALVASDTLQISQAVPIILGANVGTTLTSTLVSLGHISSKKEFRRAIAAGSLHDLFNICALIIIFPIEYYTHFLSKGAEILLHHLPIAANDDPNLEGNYLVRHLSNWIVESGKDYPFLLLLCAISFLFFSLRSFAKILERSMFKQGIHSKKIKAETQEGQEGSSLLTLLFGNKWKSFFSGLLLTSAIQSSSVTTSLIVPLVAKGRVNLPVAFPFIIGANIGTTITGLLAALFKSETALVIAFVHILFNVFGGLIFLFMPFLKMLPLYFSEKLGELAQKNRLFGFVYILVIFFILPFLLIYWTS
jgi:sodium-dependent phosphate cotransporter